MYTAVRRYHWNDRCDRAGTEKEIRPEWGMEEELRLLRSSTGPGMFFPGPVDDQQSEKDRPPQSVHSIVATKKEPEQKPKNGFCSGSSLQKHPCFAGLSFSSSP